MAFIRLLLTFSAERQVETVLFADQLRIADTSQNCYEKVPVLSSRKSLRLEKNSLKTINIHFFTIKKEIFPTRNSRRMRSVVPPDAGACRAAPAGA
jgi:hypothetical protein